MRRCVPRVLLVVSAITNSAMRMWYLPIEVWAQMRHRVGKVLFEELQRRRLEGRDLPLAERVGDLLAILIYPVGGQDILKVREVVDLETRPMRRHDQFADETAGAAMPRVDQALILARRPPVALLCMIGRHLLREVVRLHRPDLVPQNWNSGWLLLRSVNPNARGRLVPYRTGRACSSALRRT